ncbi:hypothetical protein LXL04_035477 [Taraxacum kok-saghyz]
MEIEIEAFHKQPKPQVMFYGAAARVRGHAFANILEFTASRRFYLVVVELPQVQFCDAEIEWIVHGDGEVTIEGEITPASIFTNLPIGGTTKRVKLCPSEPWGMSFHFPGPVDWWTSNVIFTSKSVMEITVMKERSLPLFLVAPLPEPDLPPVPEPVLQPVPELVLPPVPEPVLPPVPDADDNPASPTQSEIDDMVDEWIV